MLPICTRPLWAKWQSIFHICKKPFETAASNVKECNNRNSLEVWGGGVQCVILINGIGAA